MILQVVTLSYHNRDLQQIIWFLYYGNLDEIPYKEPGVWLGCFRNTDPVQSSGVGVLELVFFCWLFCVSFRSPNLTVNPPNPKLTTQPQSIEALYPEAPQRAQYPLIQEYGLNHNMKPFMI